MGCPATMRLLVVVAAARGAVFNESSRRHCTEAELEHLRTDKNAELHEVLSAVHGPRCGGFFIDMDAQPSSISWVKYTSYWYYSMGLFVKVALVPYDTKHHDMRDAIAAYSFSDLSLRANVLVLLAYGTAFRVLTYVFLKTSRKLRFS